MIEFLFSVPWYYLALGYMVIGWVAFLIADWIDPIGYYDYHQFLFFFLALWPIVAVLMPFWAIAQVSFRITRGRWP